MIKDEAIALDCRCEIETVVTSKKKKCTNVNGRSLD